MDIRKSPYAEFLEMLIGNVAELKPVKMAVVGTLPDGRAFTAQYGECDPYELALMAFHIQTDAIMDIVKANAGEILRAAEEQEDKMNNYIVINNQKIELTEEQVRRIIAAQNPQGPIIHLSDVAEGDTFKIGEHEFIVLEQSGDTTAVIRKDLLLDMAFGETNNFHGSAVDLKCNEFANEIIAIVGKENLVLHTLDLTSNDGLKDYGKIERRVSLLTADLYRRYVEILDNFKPDRWWWLATAHSTKRHENDCWVNCVAPSGYIIFFNHHFYDVIGVRPFCILKSNIFVSK